MQLVAPAGSVSALKAAVNAGADAVYLGLDRFSARAKAENFTRENFKAAIEYAHIFGCKIFVALNTLIKDNEMQQALELAKFVYDNGVDAIIVQDLRFIKAVKQYLPRLPLHASTQMGVHNKQGALALLKMGINRAVLARETLPQDIKEIKSTGIDIEFFVQGALCVAFSGNCYFSSLASSYSGNRGKCMQLCRKKYKFNNSEGYFLSAKDICLHDKLLMLEDLGVDAIKIEGRMRSDEYVYQAVSVYKSHCNHTEALDALKAVYNRGDYCSAYLDDDAQFRVIYAKSQGNIGKPVGSIAGMDKNIARVSGFTPHDGDGYKIMRRGKEVGGAVAVSGAIRVNCNCKEGDEVRLTSDGKLSQTVATAKRLLPVALDIKINSNGNPVVIAECDNIRLQTKCEFLPQSAHNEAITVQDVRRAFDKTAQYPFSPNLNIDLENGVFMPVSALNAWRRQTYKQLFDAIISLNTPERNELPQLQNIGFNCFSGHGTIIIVEDLSVINDNIAQKIDYVALNPKDYSNLSSFKNKYNIPVLLNLPVTARGNDVSILKRAIDSPDICGVISNNLYTFELTDKPILLGYGHNLIGASSVPHICSFESDNLDNGFVYVYGKAPIMTFCHCPYGTCVNCNGIDYLTDENNRKFTLRRYKTVHCYWQLLNCVPHLLNADVYNDKIYDFTTCDVKTISTVLNGEICGAHTFGNIVRGLK